jgi:hypothetical protein
MLDQGRPPVHHRYLGDSGPPRTPPHGGRRALWTVAASVLVVALLSAGAWFGALLWPRPAVTTGRHVAVASFMRGNISVMMFLTDKRPIDTATLVALAQQQSDRLPSRVA